MRCDVKYCSDAIDPSARLLVVLLQLPLMGIVGIFVMLVFVREAAAFSSLLGPCTTLVLELGDTALHISGN